MEDIRYLAIMEFRRASDRLNFFFDPHSWVLLVDTPPDGSLDSHLQVVRTACEHWGSKLEFPFQFDAQAFENSQEAHEFWLQKLPGLRLLHYRKQDIIISDLFDGYDPQRANQLLRRKLQLDENAWAHLIHFGGPQNTIVCTFQTKPEPRELREAIAHYHNNHVRSAIQQSEMVSHSIPSPFGSQHGLAELSNPSAQLILEANHASSVTRIMRTLRHELDRIHVSHYHRTITFVDMGVVACLSPQCFALYCMYLDVVDGMTNLNRDAHKHIAIDHYRRIAGIMNADDLAPIENCFNIRDDKPLRDAVYKIKREIVSKVGSAEWAKPYLIAGGNGQNKRIAISRDLVTYTD